jgi:integrase
LSGGPRIVRGGTTHAAARSGAFDWDRHVDLAADVVQVEERVYKAEHDLPKSNKPRTVALLPQAREAITALPERTGFVFRSKRGNQMSQPTMSGYWGKVLPNHDIAAQAGWSEAAVEEMVKTYAHTSMGALDRIRAAANAAERPAGALRDTKRDTLAR